MLIKKTFCKEERLCSKLLLEALFTKGSSFLIYPYRISWLKASQLQLYPVQVVIGVSKKKFKRSVDRNLIKRKIREIYRLNKQEFLYKHLSTNKLKILLAIHYIGKDIISQKVMHVKLKSVFLNLLTQLNATHD